ncbi:hypothetical protein [Enterococcus sp. LJL90]
MKKFFFIVFLLASIALTGCQINHAEKGNLSMSDQTTSSVKETKGQTSSSSDLVGNESKYATEGDVLKKEDTMIEQRSYVLYTFKGNKSVALPKDVSLEEAKIDLSVLPEIGTPKEELETGK